MAKRDKAVFSYFCAACGDQLKKPRCAKVDSGEKSGSGGLGTWRCPCTRGRAKVVRKPNKETA